MSVAYNFIRRFNDDIFYTDKDIKDASYDMMLNVLNKQIQKEITYDEYHNFKGDILQWEEDLLESIH